MNKVAKSILDAILYVITFIVVQLVVQLAGAGIYSAVSGTPFQQLLKGMGTGDYSDLIIATSVISSVITLIIFVLLKWARTDRAYLASRPWGTLAWVILFSLGTILPLQWLYEQMQVIMPENYEQLFQGIMSNPSGYLAIGMLAPLVEEIVFRGALLRRLLQVMGGKLHWVAIFISAFLFGLVHGNIAQFIHALILGCALGWMYYRTHSVVPGIVLHWVNNTVAYVMFYLMPWTAEGELIDLFGDSHTMFMALGFSLCILLPSLYQLSWRLRPVD